MFFGRYDYTIDAKGRLNFPAKFRDAMGESFVVLEWVDNCLFVLPLPEVEKLAEKLDIPFYDKELISMAADDINIAEEAFQNYDEHIVIHDPLDRQYYHAFSDIYKVPMSDQIFVAQSNVIRRLAAHGPCVIVGRCADMILDDSINLFIYSKMRDRIKRMLILEPGSDEKEMERRIREVDRKRKEYYQYYTGNTWGRAQNYHLCLDSGLTGVDGCLRAVLAYLGELSE